MQNSGYITGSDALLKVHCLFCLEIFVYGFDFNLHIFNVLEISVAFLKLKYILISCI